MLDIAWMRDNREALAAGMALLGAENAPWEEALELDTRRRSILTQVEEYRRERNEGSKRIGALFKAQRQDEAQSLRQQMTVINSHISELEGELAVVEESLENAMLQIPNLPEPDVPVSLDAGDYAVLKSHGELTEFDFEPKPHWELGSGLGIIDLERGSQAGRQPTVHTAGSGRAVAARADHLESRCPSCPSSDSKRSIRPLWSGPTAWSAPATCPSSG